MRKFLFEIGQRKSKRDKLWEEFKKISKSNGIKNLHEAIWNLIEDLIKKQNPSIIKKIKNKIGGKKVENL